MSMSDDSGQRVGNAERQTAVEALNAHWQAGRLDPAEHERRTTAAHAAVTRGDLDALFTDLPGGSLRGRGLTQDAATGAVAEPPLAGPNEPATGGGFFSRDSWIGQHRDALMALAPFVAIVLFFTTKWWVWWLLIPAAGVLLYAGNGDPNGRQARRDAREQRRRPDGE
jgi:hypothetical protein